MIDGAIHLLSCDVLHQGQATHCRTKCIVDKDTVNNKLALTKLKPPAFREQYPLRNYSTTEFHQLSWSEMCTKKDQFAQIIKKKKHTNTRRCRKSQGSKIQTFLLSQSGFSGEICKEASGIPDFCIHVWYLALTSSIGRAQFIWNSPLSNWSTFWYTF